MIKRNILDCMTLVGGTPSRYEGEKTYVSTGAVDCDHVDYAQAERVTYDNRPSRANLSVAEGDILFAKMCGTKKTLRIDRPLSEHLYSTGFCAVRANESIMDAALLYHLLASDQFLTQKDQNSSGATQKAITNAGLRKIVIQVPDLSEQRKLAANLDCIEQLMAKRREQLVSFDQLVKSRFIELFGDMFLNSKAWKKQALDSLADVVSGITKGRKTKEPQLIEVPYMAVSNVKDGYIDWTTVKTIQATQQEIEQYRLLPDDVLMTEGGDPDKLGRGAILKEPLQNCIHQNHIFRVRLNESLILPAFFEEYLKHQKAKRYFLGCAKQTTGIASINMRQLKALPVLLPPLELQEQFAAFVEQTDKSKLAVQKSLEELEILKKSLMQQYFG